ncbi:hypothetical protein M9434_006813 [Picochlorum sp. BPE23]|nr:hypothetical protein M9434_006813 [Picochlorum sp. BPE23]
MSHKTREKKIKKKKSLGPQVGVTEESDLSGKRSNAPKTRDEIDDLFSDLKKSVKQKEKQEKEKDSKHSNVEQKTKNNIEGSKDDIFGNEAENERKRTDEGYAIYTEAELGFGKKGGDTDLCPFDCDCCF